jgi:hypothetical protein
MIGDFGLSLIELSDGKRCVKVSKTTSDRHEVNPPGSRTAPAPKEESMKALMLLCSLVTVTPASSIDDDDDDLGKEVLAQRELAGKNVDAMLTAGN